VNVLQEFFAPHAALSSRLAIWNKRVGEALLRLKQGCALQKISATDDGYLVLGVYKPGDDRSSVLLSIRRGEAGLALTHVKPPAQNKPGSLVQMARKHLQGRTVLAAYASLDPVAVVIEFNPPRPGAESQEDSLLAENPFRSKEERVSARRKAKEEGDYADCLILDLDARPARICVARKLYVVPDRYSHIREAFAGTGSPMFESLCEWSLESTKTKRRPTFDVPLLPYCVLPSALEGLPQPASAHKVESKSEDNAEGKLTAEVKTKTEEKSKSLADAAPEESLQTALACFPTHVRRASKTRLQFLERRLLRQKQDLPPPHEIELLEKRAEGLRANLYMWPAASPTWYVPREVIEDFGLPAVFTLKHGERPGDLLTRAFAEIDRLKRRQQELTHRIAESAKQVEAFVSLLLVAAKDVRMLRAELAKHGDDTDRERNAQGTNRGAMEARVAQKLPVTTGRLLTQLELEWTEGSQAARAVEEERARRLPYRTYEASTGEFLRVAKSASDGDAMLRLMPSHHTWVHVMTGEGSHVWLEKPKKSKPTSQAVREAAILAIHHSRQSRAMEADVYVATRADIDKKKDLAPGKVIVRKAGSLLVRYEDAELQKVLATHGQTS
jgi:predicted ribosome quality control (RQC) complex YloA/Tae2 family protein